MGTESYALDLSPGGIAPVFGPVHMCALFAHIDRIVGESRHLFRSGKVGVKSEGDHIYDEVADMGHC